MLAKILYSGRTDAALVLRQVAAKTGIDQALVSKFEKGTRRPSESQLRMLCEIYNLDFQPVRKHWLVEKLVDLLQYEPEAIEVLEAAESRIEYLRSTRTFGVPSLSKDLQVQLNRIDQLKEKWQMRRPLRGTQLKKMHEFFRTEYTYQSNKIEGNTLSLQETHLVINEGITVGGKSMQEHLEAINHSEAVDFIMDIGSKKEDLNARNLLDLHRLILKGIDKKNAGRFRSVPVRISGSSHIPPQPYLLGKLMEDYHLHYERQKHFMHPVILAAEIHERLATIHPFIDGNGRTARLVMNLVLLRNGYTTAILKGDNNSRLKYYKALEMVQVDSNPEPFYELIAQAVEESLQQHLSMI